MVLFSSQRLQPEEGSTSCTCDWLTGQSQVSSWRSTRKQLQLQQEQQLQVFDPNTGSAEAATTTTHHSLDTRMKLIVSKGRTCSCDSSATCSSAEVSNQTALQSEKMEPVAALAALQELPTGSSLVRSGLVQHVCGLVFVRRNQAPVFHPKCLHQCRADFPDLAVKTAWTTGWPPSTAKSRGTDGPHRTGRPGPKESGLGPTGDSETWSEKIGRFGGRSCDLLHRHGVNKQSSLISL